MTKQVVNIGAVPGDGSGDPLRVSFNKINQNFTELYTDIGIFSDSSSVDYGTLDAVADPVTFSIDYGSI